MTSRRLEIVINSINSDCVLELPSYVTVHSRTYALPKQPTVAVCIDGFDPEYLAQGIAYGILPNLAHFIDHGFHTTAKSCMPSFTNPNNVSIITGVPPSIHGIAGNFYLDPVSHEEKMITDATLLRGPTILQQLSKRGVKVAAITAKDKLRRILSHGLENAICFSAEFAGEATIEANGITGVEEWIGRKAPLQYSGDLSLYVLDAGIKILEEDRADFMYLTLSDFIQHKHAPGNKDANEFMAALDQRIGRLAQLGAIVVVTGDHGMSDKSLEDGTPNVLYLQERLEERFGQGSARVICPITDPFVRHHGALGSFVRVYAKSASDVSSMLSFIKSLSGVALVLSAAEAAEYLELSLDREGDIVVVAVKNAVIGSKKEEHDLSNLGEHRLRSHGGLSEQDVLILISIPLGIQVVEGKAAWRNFDIFDLVLNSQT